MKIWNSFTNQKQWKEYLKDLIKTNDKALLKSILLIYDNQTLEEKSRKESIEENKIGFSKVDVKEMSEIALKIKKGKELTKGEFAKSRNKMQKYWKQLMTISKEKAEAERIEEENRKDLEIFLQELESEKLKEEENERMQEEIIHNCTKGIACSYGICSECHYFIRSNYNQRSKE